MGKRLYLLRHGETEYNKANLVQGAADIPLSEEGRQQAREAHIRIMEEHGLAFDRIYASPLDRAQETGEIVTGLKRTEFIIDSRLREVEAGELVGRNADEPTEVMRNFVYHPEKYIPPKGAESYPELIERAADFLNRLDTQELPDKTLICTHSGWIHAVFAYLENKDPADFWNPPIANCSMYVLEKTDNWHIIESIENKDGKALSF